MAVLSLSFRDDTTTPQLPGHNGNTTHNRLWRNARRAIARDLVAGGQAIRKACLGV